jgi:hypothetical protein
VENRFQILPFKCNLQRYTEEELEAACVTTAGLEGEAAEGTVCAAGVMVGG